MESKTLGEYLANPLYAGCRFGIEGGGDVFIIRTHSGAEHFFSVVECESPEGTHRYATVSQLLDDYGKWRPVELL
jgi:hypothetical protein